MSIEVITREYEVAHGKRPTGDGYWAFFFRPRPESGAFWFRGKYGEAKKAAIAAARKCPAHTIIVGS